MRYLNKIIFINSAHVPYAEIKLDGNVHFIGTQGVGKSTLLRAILFFYNVDKSKLGIKTQDKQKSFDEFYLPFSNSYIIYEVSRDDSKFFIITFSSQNRAAFRIVDCPYDRSFFLDEDNNARVEWGKISELIGNRIYKSNIIRGYEELRDIIYGNNPNISNKDLKRFSLLESTKYQNVPRTIQNIFLNQSLESKIIKETIIDSMDFSNDNIDLVLYREHLKSFKQQYRDIWKWYEKDKSGKIKVRTDADDVITKYTLYEYTCKQISELCGNLKFALERDNKTLPLLDQEENQCSQEYARQNRLLEEERDKYNKERDELKEKEGILKDFFITLKRKQQHYDEINIEDIIERISHEEELKIKRDSILEQEKLLTDKNNDIISKYVKLKEELDKQLREFEVNARQKRNKAEEEALKAKDRLQREYGDKLQAIRDAYQSRIEDVQEDMNNASQEKTTCQLKEQHIIHYNPYQKEMDDLQSKIANAQQRTHEIEKTIASKQREIATIVSEVELKRKELEAQCDLDIQQIENEIKQIDVRIQEKDELLSKQSGSLIEWLGENVEGWESNIGRVLDEKAVLYNTSLNPSKSEFLDSIYGVKIDVDNIEKTILTPDEIRAQRAALEEDKKVFSSRLLNRKERLKTDIAELERKPSENLKKLRLEEINLEAELTQLPNKIVSLQNELEEQRGKLSAWRNAELSEIRNKIVSIESRLRELQIQKDKITDQRDKEIEGAQKLLKKQLNNIDAEIESHISSIDQEVKMQELETSAKKQELDRSMDEELKGFGIDVNQLQDLRHQLQKLDEELIFIKNHQVEYISWMNDKKDYFDCEQIKADERKRLKEKIEDLQEKFEKRRQRLQQEVDKLSRELGRIHSLQNTIQVSINKVNGFLNSSSCPTEYINIDGIETVSSLADVLDELKDKISKRQQLLEEFRETVSIFKNNFSIHNTFNFRVEINTTAEYIEFAADLYDFVTNNKIEEYRIRTSERYAGIITQIAKEVSDLRQHNADIRLTINEINKDFRENNFAGVIKEIELRAVESNDRLMQQLLNIKSFDDENSYNIGQLNLFSNEDTQQQINQQAVGLLMTFIDMMEAEAKRDKITLADTFKLEFRVKENDNDTNWVERLSNVGSNGTDSLVKSMVNIMLINVFKNKISRKFGDFKLHCMMDEIGTLHPTNVKGILDFANARNIYLINGSPTTYNAQAYKYTYSLKKDEATSNTIVKPLLTIR